MHLPAARASRSKLLGKLYSVMQTTESQLGGGEGVEGLYGSITRNGTQEVLDGLAAHACLCEDSILVDIGAGLGRPLLHAAVSHGVRQSFGIELDKVKCDKALAFGNRVLDALKRFQCDQQPELVLGNSPVVLCSPIEAVATLSPATHAYTFWEGVCSEARQALGALFASSKTLGAISMVQRTMRCDPVAEIEGYGFGPVKLVGTCKVAMSGSGRRFTAYTFVKEGWEPPCANPMWAASHKLSHEGRVLNSPPPAKTEAAEQEAPACLSPLLPARVDIEQKPNITSDKTRRGQEVPRRGAPKQATLTSAFRAVKQRGGDAKPTAPHGGSAADEAAKTRSGRLIKPRESGR